MTTKKMVYVGIDVDDKAFHGAGLSLETGEFVQFKCKPDFGVLRKKLISHFRLTKYDFVTKHVILVILSAVHSMLLVFIVI